MVYFCTVSILLTLMLTCCVTQCDAGLSLQQSEGDRDHKLSARAAVIKRWGSCNAKGSVCGAGLTCVGPVNRKKCNKAMGVNGRCGQDPYWVCKEGLDCFEGVCCKPLIGRGRACGGRDDVCAGNMMCVGPPNQERCNELMGLGKRCGEDPYWVCEDEFECVDGRCQKPIVERGGSCELDTVVCEEPFVCVGNGGNRRCGGIEKKVGGRCGEEPFSVCRNGLICENGACRNPPVAAGGSCTSREFMCAANLRCVGPRNDRRCVKPAGVRGQCGQNPFAVCKNGLICENGKCRNPPVAVGGSCTSRDFMCAENLRCVGPRNDRRCVKPAGVREQCGQNPFAVCQNGLICENGACRNPPVAAGGSCTSRDFMCATNLRCVGPRNDRRCVKPAGVREQCGQNPFAVCQNGLICENGKCRNPPVAAGGSCTSRDFMCAENLRCVGPRNDRRCVKPAGVREQCGQNPFAVCKNGLMCANGRCRRRLIGAGGSCLGRGSVCARGLVCATRFRGRRICMKPIGLGGSCVGRSSMSGCERELRCIRRRCSKIVGKGGSCRESGKICGRRLVCAGTRRKRVCVTPMGIGKRCGQDPFWVCVRGAKCVHGICKRKKQ